MNTIKSVGAILDDMLAEADSSDSPNVDTIRLFKVAHQMFQEAFSARRCHSKAEAKAPTGISVAAEKFARAWEEGKTASPASSTSEPSYKLREIVLRAREHDLDFTSKDMVSVQGKGKEGTRFSDPSYQDRLSQKDINAISALIFTMKKDDIRKLLIMYLNRFCCEEKSGDFTWKDLTPSEHDGLKVKYVKKSREEIKDILSLYTVDGKDAYTFYIDNPCRIKHDKGDARC